MADKEDLAWDYADLDLFYPWAIDAEQAVAMASECEDAARQYHKCIINSEGATLNSHRGLHYYGNTHGFIGHYPSTRHSLSVSVIG